MAVPSGSLSRQTGIRTDLTADEVGDLNTVSAFLASPQSSLPSSTSSAFDDRPEFVFVLAGHAILPLTTALFDYLNDLPNDCPITLIIAGGIGHSTELLYGAVGRHPVYHTILTRDKSEAAVLRDILLHSYPSLARRPNFHLYLDEASTNCGSNAIEAKRILDEHGIWPERVWIIQDPTMHRRTIACFDKIYSADPRSGREGQGEGLPQFLGWSFVPRLRVDGGTLEWDTTDTSVGPVTRYNVWTMERFISLVIGEIPRLRDDEHGYGPRGKGFITHVDIPDEVEHAWTRLSRAVTVTPPG